MSDFVEDSAHMMSSGVSYEANAQLYGAASKTSKNCGGSTGSRSSKGGRLVLRRNGTSELQELASSD